MNQRKTVVFCSNTSWFLFNFRYKVIRNFVNEGYRVVCLAPSDDYSVRLVEELGAEYLPVNIEGKSTSFLKEIQAVISIFSILFKLKPIFVFNSTIKLNLYAGIACFFLRVPFGNNVSGLGTVFLHNNFLFKLVRLFYGKINQKAECLFFENEDDLSVFKNAKLLGKSRVVMLPGSGVDLEKFAASPLPLSTVVNFVMVARILGDKGVREYVSACQILKSEGFDFRSLLVGPLGVSNRTAITLDEVQKWQKEGILKYMGATDDVRPFLEKSHALVLPSYREGMPRTVLEAAAMGRPAIVTDVPGCRQSIEPEVTGWLCNVRDATSLAYSMKKFIQMAPCDRQRAGDAARQRVEEKFSEEEVVQAYFSCIRRAFDNEAQVL